MTTQVNFWGVRGSVASPGPHTLDVGGNTACLEILAGKTRVVLDAGTGLRNLGAQMLGKVGTDQAALDCTLLLSHLHFDHIQGLPFFGPLYRKDARLHVMSGPYGAPLRDMLRRQMSAPIFPVDLNAVPCDLTFGEVEVFQRFEVGEALITAAPANHPDSAYSYRIDCDGASVVYATDTEHFADVDRNLVRLAEGADLLIYDSQYLPEEYAGKTGMSRVGWGHSTYEAAVRLALAAGVKRLVLFHHDPCRDDQGVRAIETRARALFPRTDAAREGLSVVLGEA